MASFKILKAQAESITEELQSRIVTLKEGSSDLRDAFETLETALEEFKTAAEETNYARDQLVETVPAYTAFAEEFCEGGVSGEAADFFESISLEQWSSWTTDVEECESFADELIFIEMEESVDFALKVEEPEVDVAVLVEALNRLRPGLDALADLDTLSEEFPSSEMMSKAVEIVSRLPRGAIEVANRLDNFIIEISVTETIDEDKVVPIKEVEDDDVIGDFDVNGD